MDLKSTIDIILKDLKEAREIMDDLKNYPDVPEIQVELAKAKCRSAEEVLKFLILETKDSMSASRRQRLLPPETGRQEQQTAKGKIEDAFTEDTELHDEAPETGPEEMELQEDFKEEIKEDIIDQIIQPEGKEERKSEKADTDSRKILADKFRRESSINEKIASSRHDSEKAEVSKLKPLGSLSEAIGINDRFLFVRELFNGDQDLYRDTLDKLNKVSNIEDAFDILSGASKASKDNESFDLMLELVKRKLRKT